MTTERNLSFVSVPACCTFGLPDEYDPAQCDRWTDAASLAWIAYDAAARVVEGKTPNMRGLIVETVHSDAHGGPLTLATRNGLAAWHREQTDPRYSWITGRWHRDRD